MEALKYKKRFLDSFTVTIAGFFIYGLMQFGLILPGVALASSWSWMLPQRVHSMLKEGSGLWLIDVRSPIMYDAEHIESAVNISAVSLAYKKFPTSKTLVLVDDSLGQKTARSAAEGLVKNGYERVYVLEGGIIGWEFEGYPVVGNKAFVRGVTGDELRWAISNNIPLRIFDMRNKVDISKGMIKGSQLIEGKDMEERIKKLRALLKDKGNKDLSSRLRKPQTILLVFSSTENAAGFAKSIRQDINGDVRYLIGGYESFKERGNKHVKTTGGCPTCSRKK